MVSWGYRGVWFRGGYRILARGGGTSKALYPYPSQTQVSFKATSTVGRERDIDGLWYHGVILY